MDTLDNRLQKRIYVSLYAIVFLTVLLGLSVLLEGCTDRCEYINEYRYYEPVYTSLEEIRSSVEVADPAPVTTIGKIYLKDHWLFVNDPGKGIHVIDNHDPSNPVLKSFITIPGNYDLAVKGNTLYADSYIDLVAIDISDINNVHEVNRLENIFSNYNTLGFYLDPSLGLITEWVENTEVKVYESDCHAEIQPWGGIYYERGVAFTSNAKFDMSAAIAPGNGSGPGVGGSMARFTINQNYLYTIDGAELETVNITSEQNPQSVGSTSIAWDMETIFPYKTNLLIGARTGMYIINVANPEAPVKTSTYAHVRVCDPVVAQNDLAYVTLRSGTQCEGFTNQLEVIDIQNLNAPKVLNTYAMTNPHGLGIDGSTLFVCDGNDGLKVYDATDIAKIDKNQLAHYKNINSFDVIPFNNVLIMIGADGLYQYDYSDVKNIKQLSKIAITAK